MKTDHQLEVLRMQFEISQLYARHCELRIATGAYANDVVCRGDGVQLTGEELLKKELGTHLRHIINLNAILESYHQLIEK